MDRIPLPSQTWVRRRSGQWWSGPRGWGVGDDDVVLAYAGTLGGAQDLSSLVEACARLRTSRSGASSPGREPASKSSAIWQVPSVSTT